MASSASNGSNDEATANDATQEEHLDAHEWFCLVEEMKQAWAEYVKRYGKKGSLQWHDYTEQPLKSLDRLIPPSSTHNSRLGVKLMREAHPWLLELEMKDGGLHKSFEVLGREPEQMPNILLRYVELVYRDVALSLYSDLEDEEISFYKHRTGPFSATEMAVLQETPPEWVGQVTSAFSQQRFMQALSTLKGNDRWITITDRVKQLAGNAVVANDRTDVFSYIHCLLQKGLAINANDANAALLAKVRRLEHENQQYQEKFRVQDRIMTNLAFRHLMENLPERITKNEANNWDDFWRKAVEQAKRVEAINRAVDQEIKFTHPLSKLIQRYGDKNDAEFRNLGQIISTGSRLYSTLSINIHQHTGGYDARPDQWDSLPYSILSAIAPLAEKIDNGKVNWEAERARFMPSPQDMSAAAAPTPESEAVGNATPRLGGGPVTVTPSTPSSASVATAEGETSSTPKPNVSSMRGKEPEHITTPSKSPKTGTGKTLNQLLPTATSFASTIVAPPDPSPSHIMSPKLSNIPPTPIRASGPKPPAAKKSTSSTEIEPSSSSPSTAKRHPEINVETEGVTKKVTVTFANKKGRLQVVSLIPPSSTLNADEDVGGEGAVVKGEGEKGVE